MRSVRSMFFESKDSGPSAGFFIFDKNGKLLISHPTGQGDYEWSIPKGKADAGDKTILATALREVKEETGLSLDKMDGTITSLGSTTYFNYRGEKTPIHLFKFISNEELEGKYTITCDSFFGPDNTPENDEYKFVSKSDATRILPTYQALYI